MKRKGFTLIELLAVIIILGILMLIAIPSVTSYINNSRKNTYVSTINEIIKGAVIKVNGGDLDMYDTDTTYYIPTSAIKLESGKMQSPYGEIEDAYVVVTYDGESYDYYFVGKDKADVGIGEITKIDNISPSSIQTDIGAIDKTVGIEGKSKIIVFDENLNAGPSQLASRHVTGAESNNTSNENNNGNTEPVQEYNDEPIDGVYYAKGKNKQTASFGEKVKIGNEEFYVLSNDGNDLVLVTRYNLKIGERWKYTGGYGSDYIQFGEYTSDDPEYGRQSSEATAKLPEVNGTVAFSDDLNYFSYIVGDGQQRKRLVRSGYTADNVYDSNSILYPYVENYKDYITSLGITVKEARIPKMSEIVPYACPEYYSDCDKSKRIWDAPAFLFETSYWTASYHEGYTYYMAVGNWYVAADRDIHYADFSAHTFIGLRPVIVF